MFLARIALPKVNRLLLNASKKNLNVSNHGIVVRRSHSWYYRSSGESSKCISCLADAVNGFAIWWILWHLATEPGHVFGEYPYPDASKWTDEELGIPKIPKNSEGDDFDNEKQTSGMKKKKKGEC